MSIRTHNERTWLTELFYSPAHPQTRKNTKRVRRTTIVHSPLQHRGHELAVNPNSQGEVHGHFVGVSILVKVVESKMSRDENARMRNEGDTGNSYQVVHISQNRPYCPFSASAHPRGMRGPQPPRFQSFLGVNASRLSNLLNVSYQWAELLQIAMPLYVINRCVCLLCLSAEVSQLSLRPEI